MYGRIRVFIDGQWRATVLNAATIAEAMCAAGVAGSGGEAILYANDTFWLVRESYGDVLEPLQAGDSRTRGLYAKAVAAERRA